MTIPVALCCPCCDGDLQPRFAGQPDFNVLTCHCSAYPVVGGIPVLRRGTLGGGESAHRVVTLLEAGQSREALVAMLVASLPSTRRAPRWARALSRLTGVALGERYARRRRTRRAVELFSRPDEEVTAWDLMDLFYRYPQAPALMTHAFNHFAYRLGQPRHLVAASLATLIAHPTRPVLEVGSGFGHITRVLLHRAGEGNVVGLDQSFFALYVARHWIAPTGLFVCADADTGLPFRDGSFAAAVCVDGMHYLARKGLFVREARRVLEPAAPMMLSATRNRLVPYEHAAEALPPVGYARLFADVPHRIVCDADILARYLGKHGPDLSVSAPAADQEKAEFLTVVAGDERLFRAHGALADWPHAVGRLAVNPLYVVEADEGPGRPARYRRQFPTRFYEDDNREYHQYLPERVTLQPEVRADLEAGARTAAMEPLIASCVLLGLPERYLRR